MGFMETEHSQIARRENDEFYVQNVINHELLSPEEEVELGQQVQAGAAAQLEIDEAAEGENPLTAEKYEELSEAAKTGQIAKNRFVESNMRLAVKAAYDYRQRGVDIPDLVNEASFGLRRAAEKYDPNRGNRFSTYATPWVNQAVDRAVKNQERAIRVPVNVITQSWSLARHENALASRLGRLPSIDEVAQEASVEAEEVSEARRVMDQQKMSSLDKPAKSERDNEGETSPFGELLESSMYSGEQTVEEEVGAQLENETIRDFLKTAPLSERELEVIERRFMFKENSNKHDGEWSFREIGKEIGISGQRAQQVGAAAMKKLYRYAEEYGLEDSR